MATTGFSVVSSSYWIGILLFWVVDTPQALPGAPIEGPDPLPGAPIEGSEQCEVSTNGGGYSC
ncbi:MAG TPA: hypothetical protein VFH23_06790 [Jiangellaceae bacterium]|nr:hypothetical protein [Jiangellaceae bacterium]